MIFLLKRRWEVMSLFSFKVSSIIYDCNDFFYFILFISDIFFLERLLMGKCCLGSGQPSV
jgi:hypothetical protein